MTDWIVENYPESIHWHSGGTGDKLKQARSALISKRFDHQPEPFNDNVIFRVSAFECRVILPIADINLANSSKE